MGEIKSFGLIICILMLLMAYLKQVIPRGKTTYLMKAIISVFILLSIVQGVLEFDFSKWNSFLNSGYTNSELIWSDAAELVEEGLKNEFENFLDEMQIDADVEFVSVSGDQNGFEIQKVIVGGEDSVTAKNLLAGRYRIGISLIEVKNE